MFANIERHTCSCRRRARRDTVVSRQVEDTTMTQEVVSTMRLSCCMHDGTNSPGTCVEATVINVCEFGMKTEKQFEETCMLS